ncbi:uncharacterized protein H6S33_000554 [Morchella sextelata]|uniref:uncharacterized protein n=1 Tax=Morchella sextelata TaxID=1174677 RepID=UPI001D055A45|nr:uncharacterized protein H6S33_000554 [Morchella sextelata]KAH0614918.1 hypothetical protein H6S33_000554 [Morchella sextelata]
MAAYATERRIAELAVQRACLLTDKVYHSRVKGTVTKGDKSPVTIADFGAQALVIGAVHTVFPHDSIVGEEDAEVLRSEADKRESVWALVRSAVDDSAALTGDIGGVTDAEEMMALIDLGNHAGGSVGRIWALDPIDGTKGFLRGDQYAVCLALIVDGSVQVGALGCPNLPVDPAQPEGEKGILLSAVRGQGATIRPLSNPSATPTPISMRAISALSAASFCEGVEAGHSSHRQQAAIAEALGITNKSVKMDSQAKYATVARGVADIYLRLPTSATYQEKIWDHAAGSLIVEEAGGIVSDAHGNALNFGVGRTLRENKGVVAATKNIHTEVIAAVKAELAKAQL